MLRFPFDFRFGGGAFCAGLGVVENPVQVLEELSRLTEEVFFDLRNGTSALREGEDFAGRGGCFGGVGAEALGVLFPLVAREAFFGAATEFGTNRTLGRCHFVRRSFECQLIKSR